MTSAAMTGEESAGVTGKGMIKRCRRGERRRYPRGGRRHYQRGRAPLLAQGATVSATGGDGRWCGRRPQTPLPRPPLLPPLLPP